MRSGSVLTILIAASTCQSLVGQDTTRNSVASIQASLYHQATGSIDSVNLIDADPRAGSLWNTIIGEAMAHTPSGALLVLVEVKGNFVADSTGVVHLKADAPGRTLLDRSVRLRSLFSESGQMFVPFIVYGTGCGDLTLTATVSHRGKTDGTLSKTIAFPCGE